MIEDVLLEKISQVTDSRVKDAMIYSLMAGGKRIRPNLLYLVLKGYGKDPAVGDEFAAALEMIHTYSLIHDDLPAMDNDDLRRGRPTCHKQFDEATAILAGDGLLTQAFVCASKSRQPSDRVVKCIEILAEAAGADGMVLGQTLDLNEDSNSGWDELKRVHRYKTGCLLSAPLMMASVLAGEDDAVDKWQDVGIKIGLAFQIQDDILDVTSTEEELGKSNSDERNEKVTGVSLLGIEKAEILMDELYNESIEMIRSFERFSPDEMIEMVRSIQTRRK